MTDDDREFFACQFCSDVFLTADEAEACDCAEACADRGRGYGDEDADWKFKQGA